MILYVYILYIYIYTYIYIYICIYVCVCVFVCAAQCNHTCCCLYLTTILSLNNAQGTVVPRRGMECPLYGLNFQNVTGSHTPFSHLRVFLESLHKSTNTHCVSYER